jgi:DNA-binding response OmpR family regulator
VQRIALLVARPAAWDVLRAVLSGAGYDVTLSTPDPEPLDAVLDEYDPDAVLAELGTGLYPLHHLRRRLHQRGETKPLLVVALARPEHLAPAHFIVGVDEFVLPPYLPGEVLARLQLALWRTKRIDTQHIVRIGSVHIDLVQRAMSVAGRPVPLAAREYDVLAFLASHRGRPFSRDALLRHVWGHWFEGGERVVDRTISRLRHALGAPTGVAIETVRGVGYRLAAAPPASHEGSCGTWLDSPARAADERSLIHATRRPHPRFSQARSKCAAQTHSDCPH